MAEAVAEFRDRPDGGRKDKRERVGCYNWGLVNGRSQTHVSWTGESHV